MQMDTYIGRAVTPQISITCLTGAGSVLGTRLKTDRVDF